MQRLRNDEDGAVLVFAVLIIVVLLSFGAIAVDAGALYQENRELQNGADAAVLAMAQSCAAGSSQSDCWSGFASANANAVHYANLNAKDGSHAATADLSQYAARKVTVNTATSQPGSPPGTMSLFFAKIFGTNAAGATAKASAIWGSPKFGSVRTLPLVISECEWPGTIDPKPWTEASMRQLTFHKDATTGCKSAVSGADMPGGFGWIESATGCEPVISSDGVAKISTGASPPQNCDENAILAAINNKVVFVPVFVTAAGVGNNATYKFSHYAAFYVAKYNLGAPKYTSPAGFKCADPTKPSEASEKYTCIAGWFTEGSVGAGTVDPGNAGSQYGVRVFQLSE